MVPQRLSRDFGVSGCVESHRTDVLEVLKLHNMEVKVTDEENQRRAAAARIRIGRFRGIWKSAAPRTS